MSRRDFRTPSNVPATSVGRCIVVPNDAAWLGLLNAALLMLTEHWRYDQVETTDLTPEETAAIWYDIYVSTLTSACEDCPDMNCNDVLECVLPYLEASFYEDADIRINPVTNAPQVSYDGGTTWSDIPQSGNGTINAPQPTPTSGANNDAKICLASSRAALVIAEFYKQSFGAFTADLYNALGTANTFLQDVKMVLFNAIYSPYDGILEAAGFLTQDFETNYTAGELSPGALENLLCLLIEYASVDASGVVTFDYGAVRDDVIADVGINPGTALWFLLGNMQQAGLNTAGSVRITDTPLDCSPCYPEWCYSFAENFNDGTYDSSIVRSHRSTQPFMWSSPWSNDGGASVVSGALRMAGSSTNTWCAMGMFFPEVCELHDWSFTYTIQNAGTPLSAVYYLDAGGAWQVAVVAANRAASGTLSGNLNGVLARAIVFLGWSTNTGQNVLVDAMSCVTRGEGVNPWGEDNC